uniref:Uncharacterized protein n=1 Tax=uncultured marine group II/III euryarchaeote KM3_26_H05 TaxID=1456427 RepID=A0A075GW73_9EURY|nr:hypothetical protein [uncultured marine group II/III euryarchaeote KM3_26_H05]
MSFYWQCNSSAICSLLALDEALHDTSLIRWQNRPQLLTTLDELQANVKNEKGKTTQQQIQDVESLTSFLLELSDHQNLPKTIDVTISDHSLTLRLVNNRYMAVDEHGNRLYMSGAGSRDAEARMNQMASKAMNELSEKYREALQAAKELISEQEERLNALADNMSAEQLEAKRAQLNAQRSALLKANDENLKKQEEQLREVAKEMNLEVLNPVRLSRKKKFVFIRRS